MEHRCPDCTAGVMKDSTCTARLSEPLSALEALLVRHHTTIATWHSVLNNHSSTKPRSMGGPMIRSLTELKDYWTDNGSHYCRINMPCSFQHGDGIPCSVEACAETKAEASENACLRTLAHILAENQTEVRLRPKHWNISIRQLHERIDAVLRGEPLPPEDLRPLPPEVPLPRRIWGPEDLVQRYYPLSLAATQVRGAA